MKSISLALLAAVTLALGCSGDESGVQAQDAGVEVDAAGDARDASMSSETDAASEPPPTADVSIDGATGDGFVDIFDAFPLPDGPFAGCATCVRDRCGMQVNACANDEGCRAGLLCTLMTCVAAGGDAGLDLACLTRCFMDLRTASLALGSFTCINMSCGASCTPMGIGDGGVPRDVGDAGTAPNGETSVESGASNDAGSNESGASNDAGAETSDG